MPEKPLESVIHGLFYDLLRAAGVTINAEQNEKVRVQSSKLAGIIQREATVAALLAVRNFQTVINKAFEAVEADMNDLKKGMGTKEVMVMKTSGKI